MTVSKEPNILTLTAIMTSLGRRAAQLGRGGAPSHDRAGGRHGDEVSTRSFTLSESLTITVAPQTTNTIYVPPVRARDSLNGRGEGRGNLESRLQFHLP